MNNFQFAFLVTLIVGFTMNQLFDECKKMAPTSTWGMRAIAVSIVVFCNLLAATLIASLYSAVSR